jgi:hypothetical protein
MGLGQKAMKKMRKIRRMNRKIIVKKRDKKSWRKNWRMKRSSHILTLMKNIKKYSVLSATSLEES